MDMGHTIGKASKTATNVVDLSAYRLQKQNSNPANATKMEQSRASVPNEIHSIIFELSQVVKEGERKFLATL